MSTDRPRSRGVVMLGVCGGIAAYKAAEVLRGFQRAGFEVRACMTESATRFVAPLTFAALSGHPVPHGRLGGPSDADMSHVEQTRGACLFVVAPATANLIGKAAAGIADDWLTTHLLASEAPLLLAPAMNRRMWAHAAVAANVATLERRGATLVLPEAGELACGEVGPGRLADPQAIVARGLEIVARAGSLSGRTVLVTSGPTREHLDLVRFLGNRSSGRMGHALAAEAGRRGARVVLVTGPVHVPPPPGCEVVEVVSAAEMAEAVAARLPEADVAFHAAAVADYRPARTAPGKLRREDAPRLELVLERTRDVLAESVAARPRALLVGFAAEVGDDVRAAGRAKLERKGCDLLVVNRVDGEAPAFDAEENEVILMGPDGFEREIPRASKRLVAAALLDEIQGRLPVSGGVPRPARAPA